MRERNRQKMDQYVSIDIGGTAIKYGRIDGSGQILDRQEMDTQACQGGQAILGKVLAIVENSQKTGKISGVCVSTAGIVDTRKGEIIHSAPLIPDYAGICYKEAVRERFKIPCEVENDVNCAGLAEAISGAGKDSESMLMLTVGTGIGGCFVLGGKVFRGSGHSACEVGYMHMRGSDFQTLGAASALTKKVAGQKGGQSGVWDGHRIFQGAKEGDRVCVRAVDEMADVLGMGIANICYVLNPQTVVLGGGVMAQEEYLKERIEGAVARYLIPGIARNTSIRFAEHGNRAGMLGAYYHFRNCRNAFHSYESVQNKQMAAQNRF